MKKIFYIFLLFLFVNSCNDPIFTDISSSNFRIVIKGTFENDGTSGLISMSNYNGSDTDSDIQDVNSVVELTNSVDGLPSKVMIDIAEIRINGDEVSNYRQKIDEELNSSSDFFNGTGIALQSDKPKNGKTYDTVQLYIRKMAFDNAITYEPTSSGYSYLKDADFVFYESDEYGFDFNQLQITSYVDSLKENAGELLSSFPLEISIPGGFTFDKDAGETVLEIRLAIKDLIKKYEYSYYDDGEYRLVHYYGMSDWLRDVQEGEIYTGKNLHGVARVYETGNTGEVTVTATTGNYVIMIPSDDPITDYTVDHTNYDKPDKDNCYFPTEPSDPGDYIEPKIDYYLAYEKYKYEFNYAEEKCGDIDTYTAAWDEYDDEMSNFKIAPYVLLSTGTDTFKNVAPGSYKVYQASVPSAYGSLFEDNNFSAIGTTVTVTAGSNVSVP